MLGVHPSLPLPGSRTHRRGYASSSPTCPMPTLLPASPQLCCTQQPRSASVLHRQPGGTALQAAGLEFMENSREEVIYEPVSEPMSEPSTSQISAAAGKKRGVNLQQLLATWDKAVAIRSMSMLADLQRNNGEPKVKHRGPVTKKSAPRNYARYGKPFEGSKSQQSDEKQQAVSSVQAAGAFNASTQEMQQQQHEVLQQRSDREMGSVQGQLLHTDSSIEDKPSAVRTSDQYFYQQLNPRLPLYKDHHAHVHTDLPDYVAPPPSPLPEQVTQLPAISVTDVMQWLHGEPPNHLQVYTYDMVAMQAPAVVMHAAMKICSNSGRVADIERLLDAMLQTQRHTTHTWGTAFLSLAQAGHLNLAHKHFDLACKHGHDIGPVGASVLIKLSAANRNLEQALELYYRMCSVRTTFNRYMFNCLMHLCAVLGRVNDALDILTHMRAEASSNAACTPDEYTYSALLRAITRSQRWELLNSVYFAVLEENIDPVAEVWSLLILGAGRAKNTQWARNYWKAYRNRLGKVAPDPWVANAMLWTLCRSDNIEEMMEVFEQMPQWKVSPDHYTFTFLLTGITRVGASLSQIQAIVQQMRAAKIQLNAVLGTSLLNAYRRCPEVAYRVPGAVEMVLETANGLMRQMVGRRIATSRTFAVFINLYIAAGRVDVVPAMIRDAEAAGCTLTQQCYHHIYLAAQDAGQELLADRMLDERNMLRARLKAAKRLAQQRMAVRRAAWAEWSRNNRHRA